MILRACGHMEEEPECKNIASLCELYDLEVKDYCPKNHKELYDALYSGDQYDYIYLSSHGDEQGFANEDGKISISWNVFSHLLCGSNCMNDDCIIYLSCCRGGLHNVAYELLYNCQKISYIVGPRQSLASSEMLISFSILLFNIETRMIDPIVACEKIKLATDLRFICFDRLETLEEYGFILFCEDYDDKKQTKDIDKFLKNLKK